MLLLRALLLVTLAAAVFAVTCYECDSVNDLYCGVDDFQSNDIAKTDCDAMELPQADQPVIYLERPETACLTKYYKDPLAAAADASFVRRSCAFGDLTACDTQPDPVMPQLGFLGCVFCHGDLCNASPRHALASFSLLLAFGLSIIIHLNF